MTADRQYWKIDKLMTNSGYPALAKPVKNMALLGKPAAAPDRKQTAGGTPGWRVLTE